MRRHHWHGLRILLLAAAATAGWWYLTAPASLLTADWAALGWALLAAELGAWVTPRAILFFTGPAWWCALVTANQRARWRNWRKHGFPWPLRWVLGIKGRPHIPDRLRRWVYRADRFACIFCGATWDLEMEHVRPFSRGGLSSLWNFITLCAHCNEVKSDFWRYRRAHGRRSRAYYRGFEGSESAQQAEAILEAGRRAQRSLARLARLMIACLAG